MLRRTQSDDSKTPLAVTSCDLQGKSLPPGFRGALPSAPSADQDQENKSVSGLATQNSPWRPNPLLMTLGVVASAWAINNLMGANEPKKNEVPVTPEVAPLLVLSPASVLNQIDDKTLKAAVRRTYENGLFSYEFTSNENPKKLTILKGIAPGPENSEFIRELTARSVEVLGLEDGRPASLKFQASPGEQFGYDVARSTITIGLIGGLLFLLSRSLRGSMSDSFGAKNLGQILADRPKERFSDVGGCSEVIAELENLKTDISNVQLGLDTDLPHGVMLEGDTGTGKTMLARALAGETDCPFISFKGSELSTSYFVGSGVDRVRKAFEKARKARDEHTKKLRANGDVHARGVCIVFIDEIDSIASSRDHQDSSNSEEIKVVNTVLAELDNIDRSLNKDIIVLGATNRISKLDPAVIRSGRFDRHINVPGPASVAERLDILEKCSRVLFDPKGVSVKNSHSLRFLASLTHDESGATLKGILNSAMKLAQRDRRKIVTLKDLVEGYQQHKFGFKKPNLMSRQDQEMTAHHEHGHGLMALSVGIRTFVISMIPRGRTLGRVIPDPAAIHEFSPTKRQLLNRLLVTVGGRAAEVAEYGDLGSSLGASHDLAQARKIVKILISAGMLGQQFSRDVSDSPELHLTPEHLRIMDEVARNALAAAQDIIAIVTADGMKQLVNTSLARKDELVGKDAFEFYDKSLSPKVIEQMNERAKKFIENPLEERKANS